MDPLWIAVAFVLGFGMRLVRLPPLIGFLAAGFVLKGFGVEGGEAIEEIVNQRCEILLRHRTILRCLRP